MSDFMLGTRIDGYLASTRMQSPRPKGGQYAMVFLYFLMIGLHEKGEGAFSG